VDVFPNRIQWDYEKIPWNKDHNAGFFYESARNVGFTGIGLYPDWTYDGERRTGFHLDVREDTHPSSPATWGRIGREYVSYEQAYNYLETL